MFKENSSEVALSDAPLPSNIPAIVPEISNNEEIEFLEKQHGQVIEKIKNSVLGSREYLDLKEVASNIAKEITERRRPNDLQVIPDDKPIRLFTFDNWYKDNPDKILGTPKLVKNRFGKHAVTYTGSLNDLNKIDAPTEFINAADGDPTQSIIQAPVDVFSPEVQQTIETAIVASKTPHPKKKARVIGIFPDKEAPVYTFEEMYRKLNDLTHTELRVFIWHKQYIGQPLNQKWYSLINNELPDLEQWVKNGDVYVFRDQLLPAYLYFSENIYEKRIALGNDREKIVEQYGQEVYNRQLEKLSNIFSDKYKTRSTFTDPDVTKRIKLKPISKFCKDTTITTLNDEKPFKWKSVGLANSKYYGRPDVLNTQYYGEWKKTEFETLSLTEAFELWLVSYKEDYEIKKDTNYADIISIYVRQAQMPAVGSDDAAAIKAAKTIWQRRQNIAQVEGDRLFGDFMANFLKLEDQVRIETLWNETYKGYIPVDFNKIPIAFTVGKMYRGQPVDFKQEKRDGAAAIFNQGSLCIAYDVGVGKTWTAIFGVAQFIDAGYCKRPVIVVPNQTYKQWLSEIKGLLPHLRINDLYNLEQSYIDELRDKDNNIAAVEEGSISVMTYEGFEKIGFNQQTMDSLINELYDILYQEPTGSEKAKKKQTASFFERLEYLVGRGLQGTMLQIEDLGFDFVTFDEAHKAKKVFVEVKSEGDGKGGKEKNPYKIKTGGEPSSIALKVFMISQYIQKKNNGRNIMLLTATPFTNSPLEIYSMLSLVAQSHLSEHGIGNLKQFFDTYINTTEELVINAKLKPERKQVVKSFNNLQSLQQFIRRFFLYKTGEQVKVPRPNLFVLPLKSKIINGDHILVGPEERISTNIPLSPLQADLMDKIKLFASGKLDHSAICTGSSDIDMGGDVSDDPETATDATEATELDEGSLTSDEKAGVRVLRSMSYARNLALTPFLYECSGLPRWPKNAEQFISTSPKLRYVMDCIKSVRDYHIKTKTPVSGQIIYMDRGLEYFKYLKQYLVDEIGYKPHEIVMIYSGMSGGKDAKEIAKNLFLGLTRDKETGEEIDLPDDERAKILIGSSSIKEGMNLQRHTSVMYDTTVDWNPTDMKQKQGRCWRQGNMFKNVRYVVPLMEDSLDVFMFQKLEEKTARIADIWDTGSDSNTFSLEEFDPSELKSQLISDPMVLAEMQLMEGGEKIKDDARAVENEIKRIDNIIEANQEIIDDTELLKEWLEEYRPAKGAERSLKTLIALTQDVIKKQTDAKGLPMVASYNRKYGTGIEYSDISPAYKPSYFDDLNRAARNMDRAEREYLIPKNLKLSSLPKYKVKLLDDVKNLQAMAQESISDEAIKKRAQYIIDERLATAYERKDVGDRVNEFKTLNNLLLDRIQPKAPAFSCPPMKDGVRLIDQESLAQMDVCISMQPQTKELNSIDEEYTPERKRLHKFIIDKFKRDVKCVTQTQPIAVLTGGPPGSGKTTFLKKRAPWLLSKEVFHIDADEVRAELPEYKGWNSAATQRETKDIVMELIDTVGLPCEFDLVYDGTMNKMKSYFPLINKLKNLGYKIYVIYMDVPKEVSIERALGRYQRSGRYVPMEVINEVFDNGYVAFNEIKTMIDGWVMVDGVENTIIDKGGEPIPENRNYQLTDGTGTDASTDAGKDAINRVSTSDGIKQAVTGLQLLLKLSDEKDKPGIKAAIAGLKVLLKF